MPTPPIDLHDRVSYELAVRVGLAWREVRRGAAMAAIRDYLFGQGDDALELGQMDTLDLLDRDHSWRMSELADALRVDPSTATRAVQRLISSGLAERSASDDDGRVVMVTITPAGSALHAQVDVRRGALLSHILGAFDEAERPVLADMLERFVRSVDDFVSVPTVDEV